MSDETAYGHARAVRLAWVVPVGPTLRADLHLCDKVGRLSRAHAQRIIKRGDFRSAEGRLKPSTKLLPGASVELWRIPPDEEGIADPPTILFENEHFLALDKPGSLAVHPSARYLYQTLTHWLRTEGHAAHPCHRLDRETSGVLLCAKSKVAERAAKGWFRNGEMKKMYLAAVRGVVEAPFVVDAPLLLQGERGLVRIRMVVDASGAASRTRFEPVRPDVERARSLIRCFPETGRQHQLRAHLFHAGHPIVGDKLYAMGDVFFDAWTRGLADTEALPVSRQALHAARLTPPSNDLGLGVVDSPLPAAIDALVRRA